MSPSEIRRAYDAGWSLHHLSLLLTDTASTRTDPEAQALAVAIECTASVLLGILDTAIRPAADASEEGFE